MPKRKRKRVSYKEADGGGDKDGDVADLKEAARAKARAKFGFKKPGKENEDDDEDGPARKKKKSFKDDPFAALDGPRKWATFDVKPAATTLVRTFSVPQIRRKDGAVVETRLTYGALGVCRRVPPPPATPPRSFC